MALDNRFEKYTLFTPFGASQRPWPSNMGWTFKIAVHDARRAHGADFGRRRQRGAELRDPHDDRTIFTGEAALCARDRGRAY
jgi:hypothetical protein